MKGNTDIPGEYLTLADSLSSQGKTPLFFSKGKKFAGIIALADAVKTESVQAVNELKNLGIKTVMLTGDNDKAAKAAAEKTGVDEYVSSLLPQNKAGLLAIMREKGKTAMVGDGINDAPALVSADTGIAIGAGTDVAIDAADAVLVKSRLTDVPAAIRLSRRVMTIIKQNLFWALFYNCLGIPAAAGVFIPAFGLELSPMFGAAAMSISSIFVVSNALRLNLFDMYDSSKDKKIKSSVSGQVLTPQGVKELLSSKEEYNMEKTIHITGMMCPHCENTVKTALEALDGVITARASHEEGIAAVTLGAQVSDETLRSTVEEKGYTVTGID
jgi:Cu2+-exporting ATPase